MSRLEAAAITIALALAAALVACVPAAPPHQATEIECELKGQILSPLAGYGCIPKCPQGTIIEGVGVHGQTSYSCLKTTKAFQDCCDMCGGHPETMDGIDPCDQSCELSVKNFLEEPQ